MVRVSAGLYALGASQPNLFSCWQRQRLAGKFNIRVLATLDHLCAARDWADSFPNLKRVPLQQTVLVSCLQHWAARWRHFLEFWMRYLG